MTYDVREVTSILLIKFTGNSSSKILLTLLLLIKILYSLLQLFPFHKYLMRNIPRQLVDIFINLRQHKKKMSICYLP